MENAPVEERLEIIGLLLRSIKKDVGPKAQLKKTKPFTIRQFDLGQEVHVDRDELYVERGL